MRREDQEEKITSLLSGLERVDAPSGFESRVIRRIADSSAKDEVRSPIILLVLKFAAPAALLVIMGTVFILFGDNEVSNALVPPVQEEAEPAAPPAAKAPSAAEGALASTSPAELRPPAQQPPNSSARRQPASSPQIMSEDLAVQGPGEPITPPGFDPRQRNVNVTPPSSKGGLKLNNVLSFLGVSASCGDEGCRVSSISKGSFAERAGIAAGDQIISIDGRAINASTEFTGPTSFKTFRVTRGGRTIDLSLSVN